MIFPLSSQNWSQDLYSYDYMKSSDPHPTTSFQASLTIPTKLTNLLTNTKASPQVEPSQGDSPIELGDDYMPSPLDVRCGRGKSYWNHKGNVEFRNYIQRQVHRYIAAPTKTEKTNVVVSIVEDLRRNGIKFLKQEESGRWVDIGDAQAREKVGHSLRDQVTAMSRSKHLKEAKSNKTGTPARPLLKQVVGEEDTCSHSKEEMKKRRSLLETTEIVDSIERRPSWRAFAFSEIDSFTRRKSSILNEPFVTVNNAILADVARSAEAWQENIRASLTSIATHESMLSMGDAFFASLQRASFNSTTSFEALEDFSIGEFEESESTTEDDLEPLDMMIHCEHDNDDQITLDGEHLTEFFNATSSM